MRTRSRIVIGGLALLALGVVVNVVVLAYQARTVGAPQTVERPDGQLAPCPATPNCATSRADLVGLPGQLVEPLRYSGDATTAQARLIQVLSGMPRTEIVTERPGYVHALVRSPTFGFPDDLEFVFSAPGTVDTRAAARVGRGDMGKNREHLAQIAEKFEV